MHNVDFLPADYRQKHARRQSRPWQAVVALAIIVLVAMAALAQQFRRHHLQSELAAIAPVYETAVTQQNRLKESQEQLKTAKALAELYTYLRHPWPRTQLLSALAAPLPKAITLQQIQVLREAPASGSPVNAGPPVDAKAEEDRLKSLTPAERDLVKLSGQIDPLQTVVILSGSATEIDALHKYIGALDATDIFKKAELDCFNSVDNGKTVGTIQFRAVLAVEPGYGQPGGPKAPEPEDRTPAAIAQSRAAQSLAGRAAP